MVVQEGADVSPGTVLATGTCGCAKCDTTSIIILPIDVFNRNILASSVAGGCGVEESSIE